MTVISEAFDKARTGEIDNIKLMEIFFNADVVVPSFKKAIGENVYLEPLRMEVEGIVHMAVFDDFESFEKSGIKTDYASSSPAADLLYTVPAEYGIAVSTADGFFAIDPTALAGIRKLNPEKS